MNIQTFAEQIAVVQYEAYEWEQEAGRLREENEKLMELARMLDSHRKTRLNNEYLDAMDMARMIMKRAEELKDEL